MGIIRDKFVKDPVKRFWITLVLDIVLILVFLYVALHCSAEFYAGFEAGKLACFNYTILP